MFFFGNTALTKLSRVSRALLHIFILSHKSRNAVRISGLLSRLPLLIAFDSDASFRVSSLSLSLELAEETSSDIYGSFSAVSVVKENCKFSYAILFLQEIEGAF